MPAAPSGPCSRVPLLAPQPSWTLLRLMTGDKVGFRAGKELVTPEEPVSRARGGPKDTGNKLAPRGVES